MWPTLYDGPPPIGTYGALVLAGFVAGSMILVSRAPRLGIPLERLVPILVIVPLASLLGARLFEAFTTSLDKTLADPMTLLGGGFTYYGGALAGSTAALVTMRIQRLPWAKLADVLVPAMIIGNGIGRLGCLAAGCCHGAPAGESTGATPLLPGPLPQLWLGSDLPFLTVSFGPESMARFTDTPLYPTQLWSAGGLLVLGGLLVALWQFRQFDGMVAGIGLILEPILRFVIELFRGDVRGRVVALQVDQATADLLPGVSHAEAEVAGSLFGLTTSQGVGLLIVVVGVGVLFLQRRAGVSAEVPIESEV